ncbi:uncharacterized protein [Euwallacea fornicatus]|uniref:uncharacterized protein n=1 Tax=Euwallacea fornicatus TaxID=995702 RepID=UPI00338E42D1
MPKDGQGQRSNSLLCSIVGCSNSKRQTSSTAIYYLTPRETAWAEFWRRALKDRIGSTRIETAALCSKHFKPAAFERFSKILINCAVPTIFPNDDETAPPLPKQEKLMQGSTSKSKVTKRLSNSRASSSSQYQGIKYKQEGGVKREREEDDASKLSDSFLLREKEKLMQVVKRLKKEKKDLDNQLKELEKAEAETSREIKELKRQREIKHKEYFAMPLADQTLLSKCYSPAQLRRLNFRFDHAPWTEKDACVAYTISCLTSQDFQRLLNSELKYPLPGRAAPSKRRATFPSVWLEERNDEN